MNHKLNWRRLMTATLVTAAVAIPAAQADNGSGARSAHPASKRTAEVRLVSLGFGRCGDLEIFVLITNGHRSLPMC